MLDVALELDRTSTLCLSLLLAVRNSTEGLDRASTVGYNAIFAGVPKTGGTTCWLGCAKQLCVEG